MALTVTNTINAQSIGTGSNVGSQKFATKTTIAATTGKFAIGVLMTNAAGSILPVDQQPRVWYHSSNFSVHAHDAAGVFAKAARYVDVVPRYDLVAGSSSRSSRVEDVAGDYIYVWVDVPNLEVAATLTVSIVEVPISVTP